MTTDEHTGMEILDVDECWRLLESEQFGRLAVSVGGRPDIFPLNYVVYEQSIFVRTSEGSKLVSLAINQAAAFEIDGYDAASNEAWSVVLHGAARMIEHGPLEEIAEALPLFTWNTAPKHRFVQIQPHSISGRRFVAEGRH